MKEGFESAMAKKERTKKKDVRATSGRDVRAADKIIEGLQEFSDVLKSEHKLHEKLTVRKVVLNLEPIEFTPAMVLKTREALGLSQAVFARFLGVATSTVQAWEQGENEPMPLARRFMQEILHNPRAFRDRVRELASPRTLANAD